ncbi:MAG: glycosyltransferase [Armatimonadetes bacterium]|nr:glycosyltransferase [Armatimonadota bacterium]
MEELTSILLVTRDNIDYTRDCLRSINQYTPEPHELILVDNGSTDGTVAYLRSVPHAQVIQMSEPAGWAACVNRALEDAIGDYILLLDAASYVTAGWLERLIASLSEPEIGAVGPLTNIALTNPVQDVDPDYTDIQGINAFAETLARENAGQGQIVPNLALFCWLMPQSTFERVGKLDEELTIFTAQDYCLRMRLAQLKLKLARDVFVHRSYVTPWTAEELEADNLRFRQKWERVRGTLVQRAEELAGGSPPQGP